MNKEEILTSLQDLLVREFDIDRDTITLSALLYEDLDLDSIDAVDLVAWMFKLTGKRMDPETFKQMRTVEDLVNELAQQLET